jgi:sensor histidine kinase YesM
MAAFLISHLAKKKIIVNLLFLIIFAWVLLAVTHKFHSFYERDLRNFIYFFLAGVALLFIHNIALIPIKLEENNNRKYLTLIIVCIIAFVFTEVFFFVLSHPSSSKFGFNPNRLFFAGSLIKEIIIAICFPLMIVGILSAIYSSMVYGFRAISPYLEAFVHIILWTLLFALDVSTQIWIIAIFPLIMVFYMNTFWVSPILLRDKKTKTYLLGLVTLILGYYPFQTVLMTIVGYPKRDFFWEEVIVLIITLFLSFIYSYVRIKSKTKDRFFNIKLKKKESELKLLKSQVNPHFLFNTLNTLYATALSENAEKTSASIAKLANLLRYMQKDINKDFIPLENEIKYVQDYIAIQKLRCAIEPQIETQFTNIENRSISPGLFIPFVENAFKYGLDPSQPSKLSVSVVCDDENIHFSCINSYDDKFITFHKEEGFGIGIKNAKQRLELVYPKNHTFKLIKKDNEFLVNITIPIHP